MVELRARVVWGVRLIDVVVWYGCGVVCVVWLFFFLMIRRPPRSTQSRSSAASDVYKRQLYGQELGNLLAPLFNTGIQPMYIDDPGYGMHLINLSLIHISEPTRPY